MSKKTDSPLLEINLLPSEIRSVKLDLSWLSTGRVIWSTFALILIICVALLWELHMTETLKNLENSVAQIKEAVEKEKPLLKKIKDLESKKATIEEKSRSLHSIQVNRKRWVILFEYLSTSLPPGMWITSISQNGHQIDINCTTWSFSEIAMYMLKLEQKKPGITKVNLKQVNAAKINNETVYHFSIDVIFDESLGRENDLR